MRPLKKPQKGFKNLFNKKHSQTESEILVPESPSAISTQETSISNEQNLPALPQPTSNLQDRTKDSSKTLQELRKKIEQRRVTSRQ
jgi:hypothetical protein